MNEPRPAMISARPPESRSSVAKSWNTRTGSSELSTRDRAREPDALRALGRRREHDRRRRDGEVGPVVLADAEHVEPDLVGELDLLDEVAEALRRSQRLARDRVGRELRERVDAELHPRMLSPRLPRQRETPSPAGQATTDISAPACRSRSRARSRFTTCAASRPTPGIVSEVAANWKVRPTKYRPGSEATTPRS